MPWIKPSEDGSFCAEYRVPMFGDHVLASFSQAKRERAYWVQQRELVVGFQKDAAKEKDYSLAKYFSEHAAYQLKVQRGWDAAVRWIDGCKTMHWPATQKVSEEIAPYVDAAFTSLNYEIFNTPAPSGSEGE
jgi:hypothetical protein